MQEKLRVLNDTVDNNIQAKIMDYYDKNVRESKDQSLKSDSFGVNPVLRQSLDRAIENVKEGHWSGSSNVNVK